MKEALRSPFVIIALIVLVYFSIAFLIYPVLNILHATFFPEGTLTPRAFERLLDSARAVNSLRNSFVLAIVLPITVNIVGIFIVLVTRYFDIKGAKILFLGYASTLIYGGIALVAGYKFLYGHNGMLTAALHSVIPAVPINWFVGFPAVLFIMSFAATGNHLLFLTPALAKLDHNTVEAAQMMGASTWEVLRGIVLPVLKPMIFALTILTFLAGLGAMSAPLIVGGRDFQTISPMMLTFSKVPTSRDLAATLGIILGLATIILIVGLNLLERRGTYVSVSKVPATMKKQKITSPVANAIVHVLAWGLWVIYILPPLFILLFSFTDSATIQAGRLRLGAFTLENYQTVFSQASAIRPFIVSICYAGLASFIVVALMLLAARIINKYKGWLTTTLEYVLQIPWFLPSILIALAILMSFSTPNPFVGGRALAGTVWLLLIAYVVVKVPFTFRLLKAAFVGISSSLEEAASMLGAKQGYILRTVLLPLVIPATAAVFALNFNSLLDDFDMAAFLANPFFQPLGIFIRSATEGETQGDTTALVFVYTVMLMTVSGFVMWLVYGRKPRKKKTITTAQGERVPSSVLIPTGAAQKALLEEPSPNASIERES